MTTKYVLCPIHGYAHVNMNLHIHTFHTAMGEKVDVREKRGIELAMHSLLGIAISDRKMGER